MKKLFYSNPQTFELNTVVSPHFRDEKTNVKLLAQGHTGSRW